MGCVPCQTASPRVSTVALPLSFAKLLERAVRIFCNETHTSSVQSANAGPVSNSKAMGTKSRRVMSSRQLDRTTEEFDYSAASCSCDSNLAGAQGADRAKRL